MLGVLRRRAATTSIPAAGSSWCRRRPACARPRPAAPRCSRSSSRTSPRRSSSSISRARTAARAPWRRRHLVFDAANYSIPQPVTVTGVDDNVVDGPQAYLIHVTPEAADIDPVDVDVTNDDNDVAGALVTPTLGLITSESGGQATFTVVLLAQPAADVTIPLASSNPGEGTVDRTSLVFTTDVWDVPQTVTITGVDDHLHDGAQPYTIVLGAVGSADPAFLGVDPDDVQVVNIDDELQAAIVVTPTSGLVTTEAGGTATFQVVLSVAPTAPVTIGLSSSLPSEATAVGRRCCSCSTRPTGVPQDRDRHRRRRPHRRRRSAVHDRHWRRRSAPTSATPASIRTTSPARTSTTTPPASTCGRPRASSRARPASATTFRSCCTRNRSPTSRSRSRRAISPRARCSPRRSRSRPPTGTCRRR